MSFESKLQEILSDDDFDVYDRDSFSDMVDDLRDINRLHANLIMIAFDAEIFEEISDEIEIDQDFYDDHVQKMKDEFGLSDESADWVVNTCCTVYGEKVLMMDCDFRPKSGKTQNKAVKLQTSSARRNTVASSEAINLANLREGEKLPKSMIQRITEAEEEYYIDDISLTVTNDGGFGDEDSIKVVGEITSGGLKEDVVIFIMVYNAEDELIGTSFGERIDQDECNGFASFSDNVYLPKGETIAKVIVRPVQNPAGFW